MARSLVGIHPPKYSKQKKLSLKLRFRNSLIINNPFFLMSSQCHIINYFIILFARYIAYSQIIHIFVLLKNTKK